MNSFDCFVELSFCKLYPAWFYQNIERPSWSNNGDIKDIINK